MLRSLLALSLTAVVTACGADAGDESSSTDDALTAPMPDGAYEAYAAFAKAQADFTPAASAVSVLGLRGLSITGEQHPTKFGHAFDDTIVVFSADGVTARRFPASTHPFEKNGVSGVPDVDGDGASDVGMIAPGIYDVTGRARLIAGQPSFVVTRSGSGRLPGWRDTNHDGVLSDEEMAASVKRKDGLTDVLLHQGEGGAPAAVGCQVFPAAAITDFVRAAAGVTPAHSSFRYVLIDVSNADVSSLPH